MTNPNKSHITIVADRSGSMQHIQAEAEGGLLSFIADQKKVPGSCTLYFVDFDGEEPQRIVYDGDIQGFHSYHLAPRGMTPLNDAAARAIVATGERLAKLSEADRPGHVYFLIQTDGHENASHEYTTDQLRAMIKDQEDKWKWNFVFLATGPDAFGMSQMYVGTQMAAQNVMRGSASGQSMGATYTVASANIASSRTGKDVTYGADTRDADEKAKQEAESE